MPEESEVQIPGTKSKIPSKWLLIGGAVVVAFVILSKGKSGDTTGEGDGLLASEFDRRLQEQYDTLSQAITDAKAPGETTAPVASPELPVTPADTSQPSSVRSRNPWRGNPGTVAGLTVPNTKPMGEPVSYQGQPLTKPTIVSVRKQQLLLHESRSPSRRTETPVKPRPRLPESRKKTLIRRERESPILAQSTSTSTKRPPHVPVTTVTKPKTRRR